MKGSSEGKQKNEDINQQNENEKESENKELENMNKGNKVMSLDNFVNVMRACGEIIVNLADKEFISNKSIHEIKNKHIKILDKLFDKSTENKKNLEIIKRYIDKNNLEEFINRTLMETDKDKLGYVTFKEMKNVISEAGLTDFQEDILLLTKSEIFNRCDYYNLLVLFNSNNNIDINNYAQVEKNIFDNNKDNKLLSRM